MANSKLMDLTEATSTEITNISSLVLFGMLSDLTPVGVPMNELKKRVGMGNDGALLVKVTDQGMPTDQTNTILTMQSIAYDNGTWTDANSANILMCPDDKFDLAHVYWYVRFAEPAAGDNVRRAAKVQYTTVTSNKYAFERPFMSIGSIANIISTDYRVSESGDPSLQSYFSSPVHIESGDQFELAASTSGTVSCDVLEGYFGIAPFRYR